MNLPRYDLSADSSQLKFTFYSEGPRGRIKKTVQFIKLNNPRSSDDVYNLSFGDLNPDGSMNDLIVSNNKDSEKVLATVAMALVSFTNKYPNALIFAKGRTSSRTRYYKIVLTKFLSTVTRNYILWGAISEVEWELFRGDRPYVAFLAKRK